MSVVEADASRVAALDIQPVAGRIGAVVRGVNLSGKLEAPVVAAIRQALVRHKVIFFRQQEHLRPEEHEAFAGLLGTPIAHPTVPVAPGSSYILELDGDRGAANSWHTDVTFTAAYPSASILRAQVVPAAGGDTVWANTATAYNDLTPELKQIADRLWAVHTNLYDYAASASRTADDDEQSRRRAEGLRRYRDVFISTLYEAEHPVVRVHPESGERTLLLGHFIKQLIGLPKNASEELFKVLQGHVTRLENTVRWRWAAGDVAVWDNRATQHYAIDDYPGQKRLMQRVTVAGDVPVGVDGRRSVQRALDQSNSLAHAA